MKQAALVGAYLAAIVAANLSIAHWGPKAAIYNAFLFIGLDLTCRDRLHDLWRGRLILSVVFPWYVIWRLRQLSTNPEPEPQDMDQWDMGYQRAMSEIRLNIGLEK